MLANIDQYQVKHNRNICNMKIIFVVLCMFVFFTGIEVSITKILIYTFYLILSKVSRFCDLSDH